MAQEATSEHLFIWSMPPGPYLMHLTHTLPWPHHFQCTSDTSGNHCSLSAYFCAIIIGAQALHRAPYGQGTGPIHLDNLYCNSTESRLVACRHNGISVHNCVHSEDAGLRCQGMYIHMPEICSRDCTLMRMDNFYPIDLLYIKL